MFMCMVVLSAEAFSGHHTYSVLLPSASAHDSLAVQEEPITQSTRSKSGSAHSLTSVLVRGLQNSFKYVHTLHVGPTLLMAYYL